MPKIESSTLLFLSAREEQIVNATIYLWKTNLENNCCVPDYHLLEYPELSMSIMRQIRDIVQNQEKNNA